MRVQPIISMPFYLVIKTTFLVAIVAWTWLAGQAHAATLLNVSYDVTREFYQEVNAAYVSQLKAKGAEPIEIRQSHGGSSKQARSVLDGLEADVVTMNNPLDIDVLAGTRRLVATNWETRLPYRSRPNYSTILFVVRAGNPKGIADWSDLIKPGVQVIIPNPIFRPQDPTLLAKFADRFRPVKLFAVEEVFGSWAQVQRLHFDEGGQFDQIWTRER